MDYGNRLVVVTGGTGALGIAVVGALLEVGAVCHVPYRSESEAKRFPYAANKRCRSYRSETSPMKGRSGILRQL